MRATRQAWAAESASDGPDTKAAASPVVLAADDPDVLGIEPNLLRRVADSGALVLASVPKHMLVRSDGDLDPYWASVADCILG
ncbi:MAG: hypothetical protein ACRDQD_31755, partial [Nocardioidaceae bacterium]